MAIHWLFKQLNNKNNFLGGVGRECATGHQEMLLTGHEDGSIKFWQASNEQLQVYCSSFNYF